MSVNYILSQYIDEAMSQAVYDKLEDGTFVGRIPSCKGVIAFASTLRQCENELRSTLEDWILVGLKLRHPLPVINNISRWTPCKRRDFIKKLRRLGFDGPFSGSRHQFMVFDDNRLTIPSNDEYSLAQLRMMIREVEEVIARLLSLDEWVSL